MQLLWLLEVYKVISSFCRLVCKHLLSNQQVAAKLEKVRLKPEAKQRLLTFKVNKSYTEQLLFSKVCLWFELHFFLKENFTIAYWLLRDCLQTTLQKLVIGFVILLATKAVAL